MGKLTQTQLELLRQLGLYRYRGRFRSESSHGKPIGLIPKQVIHLAFNTQASHMPLAEREEFQLTGIGLQLESSYLSRRTFLLPGTNCLFGSRRFIEVKGYGGNGRTLYLHLHPEGDLYCGMLMPYARREFELPLLCEARGIGPVQLPILLAEIPEAEFIRHATWGFSLRLAARITFEPNLSESVRQILGIAWPDDKLLDHSEDLGAKVASIFYDQYRQYGLAGAKHWIEASRLKAEADGLWKLGSAGVVWRAVRSPIRVGDYGNPLIDTPLNHTIAKMIGKTVRGLLELGYYCLTPHTGNWTTAGEFVDFEDIVSFTHDRAEFFEMMAFFNRQTLNDFITLSFEKCIGYLAAPFQEGFIGKPTTTSEVIGLTREILSQFGDVDF